MQRIVSDVHFGWRSNMLPIKLNKLIDSDLVCNIEVAGNVRPPNNGIKVGQGKVAGWQKYRQ